MKQILKELSFEYLPMLSEFITAYDNSILYYERNDMAVIVPYKDLITQPFTPSQLVACKYGVPMEEPKKEDFHLEVTREQGGENEVTTEFREDYFNEAIEEYQKAVDAVIFEGWRDVWSGEVMNTEGQKISLTTVNTIESFINNGGKLKLK